MEYLMWIGISACVAIIGGWLIYKTKLPGGMMIGAMFAVALLQIYTMKVQVPPLSKELAQVIAGSFVGASLGKREIKRLPQLWRSLIVIITMLVFINIGCGILIAYFTSLDLVTGLLGTIPGGMNSIPLLSEDFGANPLAVTILQFSRMFMGIALFPSIVNHIANQFARPDNDLNPHLLEDNSSFTVDQKKRIFLRPSMALGLVTIVSLLIHQSFPYLNIMVCAVVTMAIFKLIFDIRTFPLWLRRTAQVLSGWYIGSQMSRDHLHILNQLIIPILITCLMYLTGCLIIGWLIHRIQPMPLKNGFLSAIPAGASDMALIAADLDIQDPDISVIQVLRLIIVTSLFPQITQVVLNIM